MIGSDRMEKTNPVTRKIVNDALRARGRDESLREGEGFFYFGGGEAVNWLTSSVMVKKISDLTLQQWLKVFDALRIQEATLRRQMAATMLARKGKKSRK
jgi:hypothetical protein